MKRGILVLLFILILAFSVSAMTVSLEAPPHEQPYEDGAPVSLTCKGTIMPIPGEELDNLTLYFKNNESTEWHAETTEEPAPATNQVFPVSGLVNGTYTWNCLAVSNNTNEGGEGNEETWANSNRTFTITFTEAAPAGNTAPAWAAIADWTIDKDAYATPFTIDLSDNISDTEDDDEDLQISWSETNTSAVKVDSIANGTDVIQFSTVTDVSGSNTITLTLVDLGGLTSTEDFTITVTGGNTAPYLSDIIPNKTWNQDTTAKIDLDDYFADVEDPDSSLNYSYDFTSSAPININVTIEDDGDAKFTPDDDWTGTETLTFTAYDTGNLTVTSNEVILTVQETNTTGSEPEIDSWSPESDPTISVGESQEFSITKSGPNAMNVTWYVDNVIQENETEDSFTYTATTTGSFTIKVAVSDEQSSVTYDWTLTVKKATTKTDETAPPPDEEEPEEDVSICGDDLCERSEGENCVSCPEDCGCPSGTTCNEKRKSCVKEVKSRNIILLIIILVLFGGGAGAGIYFYKKKQEKEIFGLASTPFKLPPKGAGGFKKEEVKRPKKPAVVKEPVKKPLKTAKTTNQVLLKKYIIYNLKKGKSFDQIKKELIKVGWTGAQIQDAYTAAQLDEAFS